MFTLESQVIHYFLTIRIFPNFIFFSYSVYIRQTTTAISCQYSKFPLSQGPSLYQHAKMITPDELNQLFCVYIWGTNHCGMNITKQNTLKISHVRLQLCPKHFQNYLTHKVTSIHLHTLQTHPYPFPPLGDNLATNFTEKTEISTRKLLPTLSATLSNAREVFIFFSRIQPLFPSQGCCLIYLASRDSSISIYIGSFHKHFILLKLFVTHKSQ